MTALPKYDRLETTGLWRERPDAQRRDVTVSFGDASLIIRDRTDAPVAHWSLAAIERVNPHKRPALYRPGPDAGETLEIADGEMIDAIEKVSRAIARTGPHHGRLRLAFLAAAVAGITALGMFWLPGALSAHAVSVIPQITRNAIGETLMTHVARLAGTTCDSPLGLAALDRLKARVLGNQMRQVHIVSGTTRDVLVLPGRLMLLSRGLVEDHETPDVVAGYMLAGSETAHLPDPILSLLEFGGIRTSFRLLTTGEISDDVLRAYAQDLMTDTPPTPPIDRLAARFKQAKVALSPYAYALDITGESSVALIEADAYADRPAPSLLPDGDWLSLQAICGG